MHEYKAGDKVKVVGLPEGRKWFSPLAKNMKLKNGDILEIGNPPLVKSKILTEMHGPCLTLTPRGYIPLSWIEPYTKENISVQVCKCNVWVTGCICGVFTSEKEKRNNV